MSVKYLSIDIGFKNPSFIIIDYNENINSISNIWIYNNINIIKIKDINLYLEYFISKKINKVIIEKQFMGKNINLMYYIYGYFEANNIEVIIKNPIAYLLNKNKDKENTRKIKKGFSVDVLNNILEKNNLQYKFLYKYNDICDAINICLNYLYSQTKHKKEENYVNDFSIEILNIKFISLESVYEDS